MQQTCKQCQTSFEISDADQTFYTQLGVPVPTLCPEDRYRRRLMWRNERNYYLRKCNATGETIVSIFSPDKEWPPVYSQSYWYSDAWDPMDYGKDFDFSKTFFEQFGELFRVVPQIAMQNFGSENSEYTNQSQNNKDCYLITCSGDNRDCYYGMWYQGSRDSSDCLYLGESELCYEILNGKKCYHCRYSENLQNCNDCFFCKNCIGCSDCFGSVNLRNKKFYIFNESYSEIEYKKKMLEFDLESKSKLESFQKKFEDFSLQFPHKYYEGSNIENATGDYIIGMKNSSECFNCRESEEVSYCQDMWGSHHSLDITEALDNTFCVELEGSVYNNNDMFSMKISNTHNVVYSSHCLQCRDLFACIGLRNKQYCIFNQQYSKEEYEIMKTRIIEHMKQAGSGLSVAGHDIQPQIPTTHNLPRTITSEWGEHFDPRYSPFGYNETVAYEYFPLTKEEALTQGYRWKDIDMKQYQPATIQVPDRFEEIPANVLEGILACHSCGKNYRIIKKELDFYKKLRLPLPADCSDCRHQKRMRKRNQRKLVERTCTRCQKVLSSTFQKDYQGIVYCEECYVGSVN